MLVRKACAAVFTVREPAFGTEHNKEEEKDMRRVFAVTLLLGLCLHGSDAAAQRTNAERRAAELAAFFSKRKHEVREKKGVRVEKFKEVKSEPAVRGDAAAYAGEYESDTGCGLTLRVAAGGAVEADGCEPGPDGNRRFTLRGARLEGALLTGTKVYDDGTNEKFEGLFINRTDRDSPTDAGTTAFGLGVIFDPPKTAHNGSYTLSRLFYRKK